MKNNHNSTIVFLLTTVTHRRSATSTTNTTTKLASPSLPLLLLHFIPPAKLHCSANIIHYPLFMDQTRSDPNQKGWVWFKKIPKIL
jgi:hypothetical protein